MAVDRYVRDMIAFGDTQVIQIQTPSEGNVLDRAVGHGKLARLDACIFAGAVLNLLAGGVGINIAFLGADDDMPCLVCKNIHVIFRDP